MQVQVEAAGGKLQQRSFEPAAALTTKAGSLTSLNTLERGCSAHMNLKELHFLSNPGSDSAGGGGGNGGTTPTQTHKRPPARPPMPPEIFLELPNLTDHQFAIPIFSTAERANSPSQTPTQGRLDNDSTTALPQRPPPLSPQVKIMSILLFDPLYEWRRLK